MDIYTTQNFRPPSPGGAGQCPVPRRPSVQRDVGVHFSRGTGSESTGNIKTRLVGLNRKDVNSESCRGSAGPPGPTTCHPHPGTGDSESRGLVCPVWGLLLERPVQLTRWEPMPADRSCWQVYTKNVSCPGSGEPDEQQAPTSLHQHLLCYHLRHGDKDTRSPDMK